MVNQYIYIYIYVYIYIYIYIYIYTGIIYVLYTVVNTKFAHFSVNNIL